MKRLLKAFADSALAKNPLVTEAVGVAPLLLFSVSLWQGLVAGACTLVVLLLGALFGALTKTVLPRSVAPFAYFAVSLVLCVLLGTAVGLALPSLAALTASLVPLVAFNTLFLTVSDRATRSENVGFAVVEALGTGVSYAVVLAAVAAVREILSVGSVAGFVLFGADKGCALFALPAGGMLVLACWLALLRFIRSKTGKGGDRV